MDGILGDYPPLTLRLRAGSWPTSVTLFDGLKPQFESVTGRRVRPTRVRAAGLAECLLSVVPGLEQGTLSLA
jgi:hypothetical protein